MVLQVDRQVELSLLVAVIQGRDHLKILDACLGLRPQKDIPLDTADPPKVLTLQVGARAPTEDL